MKFGSDTIAADGRYGMPENHMEALQKAAEKIGPIGVRPVSRFAKSFIEEGCPTKPFAVKNKSANSGVAAGLIPINPLYGRDTQDKYAKHTEDLKKAYDKDPGLKAIPLTLTESRLRELGSLFDANISIKQNTNSDPMEYAISWKKEGSVVRAKAIQDKADGTFSIYDSNNQPIEVLGRRIVDKNHERVYKPITADYDLLVVCPPYTDFEPGGKDKSAFRTQGELKSSEEKNIGRVMASTLEGYTGPTESKLGGNWSKRVHDAVETINVAISSFDKNRNGFGLQTVHHNAEFNNPFADKLENNVPCLMVLPRAMDLSSIQGMQDRPEAKQATIILIESPAEMRQLRDVLREQGYYWPAHAKYKADIRPFRDEAVTAATSAANNILARQTAAKNKIENTAPKPVAPEPSKAAKVSDLVNKFEAQIQEDKSRSAIIRNRMPPEKYKAFHGTPVNEPKNKATKEDPETKNNPTKPRRM